MKINLRNNVRTTMASRGINSWSELARRLTDRQDYKISRTSLTRMIERDDPAYPLKLIEALCNELACLPNDLFYIEISDSNQEELEGILNRHQPFEFGVITYEAGRASQKEIDSTASQVKVSPMKQKSNVLHEDDIDELIGDKVTHLTRHNLEK